MVYIPPVIPELGSDAAIAVSTMIIVINLSDGIYQIIMLLIRLLMIRKRSIIRTFKVSQ